MNRAHEPKREPGAPSAPWPGAEPNSEPAPRRGSRARDVAVFLPLLGLFLLMPPMIGLFAIDLDIAGLPLIVVYVFGVWLALVICAALLARRLIPARASDAADGRAD